MEYGAAVRAPEYDFLICGAAGCEKPVTLVDLRGAYVSDLYSAGWKAVLEHLPAQQAGLTAAMFGLLCISGLTLLWRGAKLAVPSIVIGIGLAFAVLGIPLANWAATSIPLTSAICGVAGLILGGLLFRLWLSLIVAACFVVLSLGVYTDRVLSPHLHAYFSRNYDAQGGLVTLPGDASGVAGAPPAGWAVMADVWQYLGQNVHQFQISFGAIALVMGVVGLLVGWKMPNFSRSVGAATLGTGATFVSLTFLLDRYWPSILAQLQSLGNAGWLIVAAVWLLSLWANYRSITPKKEKAAAAAASPIKAAVGGQPI